MSNLGQESIRRVFTEVFSARDIAEPLVSFDAAISSEQLTTLVQQQTFEVIGVRRDGLVVGYAKCDSAANETELPVSNFEEAQLIRDSAPLSEVVIRLQSEPRLFVTMLGTVAGIITKTDLQKPAVRMWLFGLVTLIEMRFTRMIGRVCPSESWKEFLSPGRIQKAESLQAERARRGQRVDLIDCLQFSDKGTIFARNSELRDLTVFQSRRQLEEAFKGVERLRNNLAHSQDIISGDWNIIIGMTENLERIIQGPQIVED